MSTAALPDPRSRWARLRAELDRFNRRVAPWLSLATGVAVAVLWREGIDHVRAAIVLSSLAGVVTLIVLHPRWEARSPQASWLPGAAGWGAVTLAQNALWFVIPFFVLSTTWPSRNVPFTLLLCGLSVASCFEAQLRERLARGGPFAAAFVVPVTFACLQLFLPVLTGLPPRHLAWASGAVAAAVAVALIRPPGFTRFGRAARAVILVALLVVGAAAGRLLLPLLPPAPLRLVSAHFALERDGLDPAVPTPVLPADRTGPSYVFLAIEAPRGARETVRVLLEGAAHDETRPLDIVGGRPEGYRLWTAFRPDGPGRVQAIVRTEGGQIVGTADAPVRPRASAAPPPPPVATPGP